MFPSFEPEAEFREIELDPAQPDNALVLNPELRIPQFIGLKDSVALSLGRRKVVVVGLGSVGRRIAMHLIRLGIAVIWLIDPDFYTVTNLLTQDIVPADLGHSKVGRAGAACKSISPATQVLVHEGRLQDLDPVTMADADVVFLATDNLVAELEASNRFRLLGVPILQASVHGETLVAQVRFVENREATSPCLVCAFGSAEISHLNQETVFRCSGPGSREQIKVMPTISTSFLCSLAADFALTQWVRHVLKLGQPVTDTWLQYCGFTHRLTQSPLFLKGDCIGQHTVLERAYLPRTVGEFTTAELALHAGFDKTRIDELAFTAGALSFVEAAICGCSSHQLNWFHFSGDNLGCCSDCNGEIVGQPFYMTRPTPGNILATRHGVWRHFGAGDAEWAVVSDYQRGVLLQAVAERELPTTTGKGNCDEV